MNIIILGPQGSGKGTQADMISEKYNLLHIETGKILREMAKSDDPLSKEIRETMMEGRLVSDMILGKIIEGVLQTKDKRGLLLDGTPRDITQYDLIKNILERRGERIDRVILINISEEETIKRLTSRRTCERCGNVYNIVTKPSPNGDMCECGGLLVQREDDFPESIKKRLQLYHEQTGAVLSEAKREGILIEINGERPVEVIFKDIVDAIEKINGENTVKN